VHILSLHGGLLPSYWVSPGKNSAIMLEGSERIGSATYFVDAHQPQFAGGPRPNDGTSKCRKLLVVT
jgi:hypothetical protein